MSERPEYGIVIDDTIDAVYLRDLCQKAANTHCERAGTATARRAVKDNTEKYVMFQKYADRFEHIRKEEVARMSEALGVTT